MMMVMMMMMTMMANTIPYRRTKTHIWDKVLMGIWVHPIRMIEMIMNMMIMSKVMDGPAKEVVVGAMEMLEALHLSAGAHLLGVPTLSTSARLVLCQGGEAHLL